MSSFLATVESALDNKQAYLVISAALLVATLVVVFFRLWRAEARLRAALERAESAEREAKENSDSACWWYNLSPFRKLVTRYLDALREYERIAEGAGGSGWEEINILGAEKELSDALLALVINPVNEVSFGAASHCLESIMIGYSGGGYRHSMHTVLRESWIRLLDADMEIEA